MALARLVATVAAHYRLDGQEAADVLQETRIALWQLGPAVQVSRAWVLRTARNKAVDLVRTKIRARARERAFTRLEIERARDPDLKHLLHARVAKLPARLRGFYDLHYTAGWSEREIATHLGLCRASVRWLDRCCRRYVAGRVAPD